METAFVVPLLIAAGLFLYYLAYVYVVYNWPKEVENLFYPQKNLQRKDVPLPDFQYYYDRIHAPGSRMNISFVELVKLLSGYSRQTRTRYHSFMSVEIMTICLFWL